MVTIRDGAGYFASRGRSRSCSAVKDRYLAASGNPGGRRAEVHPMLAFVFVRCGHRVERTSQLFAAPRFEYYAVVSFTIAGRHAAPLQQEVHQP
jgi:hypothetical protein